MNNAPSFVPQGVEVPEFKMDVSMWDLTLDQFEKKNFIGSLYSVLDYVSPDIRKKYGDESQKKFSIPHGSMIVNIEIKDDEVFINAPFIRLPEKNSVPLLRQVAQLNFSPLNLAQIELKDDIMSFNYRCKLFACEPYKIYYILKEICHNGDRYDDDFTDRFSATLVNPPQIKMLDDAAQEKIWTQVSNYINEAKEYLDYFDSKRLYYFSLDILSITFKKIDYYANPQGSIRNSVERTLAYIEDSKSTVSLTDKVNYGKQQLLKLIEGGKENFSKNIYQSEIFIPYRFRGTYNNIKENFTKGFETATKEINNNDYMAATLTCEYNFMNMYYYNNVPADIDQLAKKALLDSSKKAWKDSGTILYNAVKNLMEGRIPAAETAKKKKGFFSSWFNS